MTTTQVIEALQQLDPSGELEVMVGYDSIYAPIEEIGVQSHRRGESTHIVLIDSGT